MSITAVRRGKIFFVREKRKYVAFYSARIKALPGAAFLLAYASGTILTSY